MSRNTLRSCPATSAPCAKSNLTSNAGNDNIASPIVEDRCVCRRLMMEEESTIGRKLLDTMPELSTFSEVIGTKNNKEKLNIK